eukprot:3253882-Pyramimonas_sp.AAC.1
MTLLRRRPNTTQAWKECRATIPCRQSLSSSTLLSTYLKRPSAHAMSKHEELVKNARQTLSTIDLVTRWNNTVAHTTPIGAHLFSAPWAPPLTLCGVSSGSTTTQGALARRHRNLALDDIVMLLSLGPVLVFLTCWTCDGAEVDAQ